MDNKEIISSSKAEKKHISDPEQGNSSRIETTGDYERQEISDEKAKLLGDVSTGARIKTITIETVAKTGDKTSASSSVTLDSNENAEAALKAAESARKAVFSCRCVIEIGAVAVCEGQKRVRTALKYVRKAHPKHVHHYLVVVNKYRIILNRVTQSVRAAEEAREKAEIAAENAEKAGKELSEAVKKSNIKDVELWATSATTTAKQTRIDTFKAAHAVLNATKKFWQEIGDVINLETSLKELIPSSNGALETSNTLLVIALLLGCIIIIINHYVEIENHPYHLVLFNGCVLILISVLTGIGRIIGYCTDEKNVVEKMMIRRNLQSAEDHLRAYDDYFAKNRITPVPSDSPEVPDFSYP